MPDINLSWTPAPTNANSIGQRAKAIARVNGSVPNMTAVFIPANNMGVAVSSAIFRTSNFNIAYRFMVENICSSGGPMANTNGIREGIVFTCIPPTVKAGDTTSTTYTARILKGAYTQIDGVNYPNSYSDIEAVEFSLYDATNSTLIQGPILVNTITGTGTSESFEHTFTGLTGSTSYTPRFALLSTIDGVVVRSDAVGYLGTKCVHPAITTTNTNTSICSIYDINNQGVTSADYTYTPCTSTIPMTSTIPANGRFSVCAENGSVSATGNVVITQGASCGTINGGGWSVTNNRTTSEIQTFDFAINNVQVTNGNTSSVSPNNSITGTSTLIPTTNANVSFTISNSMINSVKLNGILPLTTSGPEGTGTPVTYGWTNVNSSQLNFVIMGN